MTTTTTSNEKTRLIVGGLLIAAAVAIGAGTDSWTSERGVQAPVLDAMHATPHAPMAAPAVERGPGPQPEAAAPVPATDEMPVVKAPAIAPSAAIDGALEEALLVLEGSASWYADALAGRRTASGEPYDPSDLIAAHRALPFGTRLRVTNLANDRSVEVRVIDRGPFVAGRILDLSRSAAEEIGIIRAGHGRVRVEVLEYGG